MLTPDNSRKFLIRKTLLLARSIPVKCRTRQMVISPFMIPNTVLFESLPPLLDRRLTCNIQQKKYDLLIRVYVCPYARTCTSYIVHMIKSYVHTYLRKFYVSMYVCRY